MTPPATRRSLATAIVAALCLAVVSGAGVLIYQRASALLPSKGLAAKEPSAPRAASTKTAAAKRKEEDSSWSHSRLVVVRPADKQPVVMLGHPTGATELGQVEGLQCGLLAAS